MIPGQSLSNPTIWNPYIPPDDVIPYLPTQSLQLGGIGLSDPTQGLEVQDWTLDLVASNILLDTFVISAPNTPTTQLYQLPSGQSASTCSLAFDQNMKPAIGYMQDSGGYLWWWDATIPAYQVLFLGSTITSVQLTMDDKRSAQTGAGTNDIICAYTDSNNLYYRQLRDRFQTQYTLAFPVGLPNPQLLKVGMNEDWRLQFYLQGNLYQ